MRAATACAKAGPAVSTRHLPASVSATLRVARGRSTTRSCSSSCRTDWLTADLKTQSRLTCLTCCSPLSLWTKPAFFASFRPTARTSPTRGVDMKSLVTTVAWALDALAYVTGAGAPAGGSRCPHRIARSSARADADCDGGLWPGAALERRHRCNRPLLPTSRRPRGGAGTDDPPVSNEMVLRPAVQEF